MSQQASSNGTNQRVILRCRNLAIDYAVRGGSVSAVRDVSFDLHPGEVLALVGESGCGKSTVAFGLVGFLGRNGAITGGSIELLGDDLVGLDPGQLRAIRGKRVSMVYQDPMSALNPTMRIGRQLEEVLTEHNPITAKEARKQCVDMLEQVHIADARGIMARYPFQLSGGQQQRVLIAAALLNKPELLIMDEPTTGLDVTIEATVLDLVEEIKLRYGTAVVFITHDLGVVARIADRLAVMYAGEIVEQGPVSEVFEAPLHPYTRGLLSCIPGRLLTKKQGLLEAVPGVVPPPGELPTGCLFEPRCQFSGERCSERPNLTDLGHPHAVRCHYAKELRETGFISENPIAGSTPREWIPSSRASGGELLRATGLSTYYAHKSGQNAGAIGFKKQQLKAVDGVAFALSVGETLGIVGESGSGKSTLARTILGLEPLTAGEIDFMGMSLTAPVTARKRDTLRLLQMIFQNPDSALNPTFRVGETIARSVIKLTDTPRSGVRARVNELLASVKLSEAYYDRYPRQLSGGEKQRVAIAAALAGDPSLIVADEPTSALDVSVQASVLNLMMEIQQRNSTAFIVISHDISVVRYLADWIAVMYLGHIVEFGPADEFLHAPLHPYTQALLSAVPIPDPRVEPAKIRLSGSIPSALSPPEGCVFRTRCLHYIGEICHTPPPLRPLTRDHQIACHHDDDYLNGIDADTPIPLPTPIER